MTPDPLRIAGGENQYRYCNNTINEVDPLGLLNTTSQGNESVVGAVSDHVETPPHAVVNALSTFEGKRYRFGSYEYILDKKGMKHILERHHPDYWDGSVKKDQTFLPEDMSVSDVEDAVSSVLKQNRDILAERGNARMYQIRGTYGGIEFVLGLKNGRVGQFYKK